MKRVIGLIGLLFSSMSFAHNDDSAPSLGSWYKDLNKSVAACMLQSAFELKDMGIRDIVENNYGIYGVYRGNRVVVKCMERDANSTLLVMVAGHDHDVVEVLRNRIVKAIN